jgi:hypothetical protein
MHEEQLGYAGDQFGDSPPEKIDKITCFRAEILVQFAAETYPKKKKSKHGFGGTFLVLKRPPDFFVLNALHFAILSCGQNMPAHPWTTLPERTYLHTQITPYRTAQDAGTLARYWVKLYTQFFERFPMEPKVGLPLRVQGAPPMTPDQLKVLGDETAKTKAVSGQSTG